MAQAIQAAMREAGSVKMTEAEKYQAYARLLRQQIDRIEQAPIIPAPFEALIRLNMRGSESFVQDALGICPTCGNRAV